MTIDAADQTITLKMSSRQFNSLLHEAHGNPETDDWKTPTLSKSIRGGEFETVEIFADTSLGAILAMHERGANIVEVTVRRPGDGAYRAVGDMIAEARRAYREGF